VVLVVLNEAQTTAALGLRLTPLIREAIKGTPPIKEGRWAFLPVTTAAAARDVRSLVAIGAG